MKRLTVKDEQGNWKIRDFTEILPAYWTACNRLAEYEDTEMTPEEIERMHDEFGRGVSLRGFFAERLQIVREIPTERLREIAAAEKEGRCAVLSEPMLPMVVSRKATECDFYCPDCGGRLSDAWPLCDFEKQKREMVQCPHCGQAIDSRKTIKRRRGEANDGKGMAE